MNTLAMLPLPPKGQHTLFNISFNMLKAICCIQHIEQCAMGDTLECNMLKGCMTTTVVSMVGVNNLI